MPSDPTVAVLETGYGAGAYMSVGVGLLGVGLGCLLVVVFVRNLRRG
jgi:hypothetical protein